MKNIFKISLLILFAVSLTSCYNLSSNTSTKTENLTGYITLFSIWDSQLNINFNANDGDGIMAEETVAKGSDFTIPPNTFTRSGYYFHGWNTNADGSGTSYADGATIENLTEDTTLYAVWDLQVHISFDAHHGTGTLAEQIVPQGADFTVSPNASDAFSRDYYSFHHWNTHADGSGLDYADGDVIPHVSTDITLYATWVLLPHVINYIDFDEDQSMEELFETIEDPDGTLSIQNQTAKYGYALKKNLGSTHRLDVPFNGTMNYHDFWVMYDFYVESTDIFSAATGMPLVLFCDSTRFDANGINKLIGTPLLNRYDDEPEEPGFKYIRPVTNILSTNPSAPNSFEKICQRVPDYSWPIYESFQMMNTWHNVKLHIKMDTTLSGLDLYLDKQLLIQSITEGDAPEEIDFNLLRIWDHDDAQYTPNSNIYIDNIGLFTENPDA